MTQQLGVLAALPKDLGGFPTVTWLLTAICTSTSKESDSFYWSPQASGAQVIKSYM